MSRSWEEMIFFDALVKIPFETGRRGSSGWFDPDFSGTSGTSGTTGTSGQSANYIGTSTTSIDLSSLVIGNNTTLTTSPNYDPATNVPEPIKYRTKE